MKKQTWRAPAFKDEKFDWGEIENEFTQARFEGPEDLIEMIKYYTVPKSAFDHERIISQGNEQAAQDYLKQLNEFDCPTCWTKIRTEDLKKLTMELLELRGKLADATEIADYEHNEALCMQKKLEKVQEWVEKHRGHTGVYELNQILTSTKVKK